MTNASEECLGDLGFMFDAHHSKVELSVALHGGRLLRLRAIGTDPGHRQSGQYLWPAAAFLANHLIDAWETVGAACVCELGAGCGLVGITAELLGASTVLMTDHDAGTLTLIRENVALNCAHPSACTAALFEWGADTRAIHPTLIDLVLGADLLYCIEVVLPLLTSVSQLLSLKGRFILCTSFDLGKDIENALLIVSQSLGLEYFEVSPLTPSSCRIQYFRRVEHAPSVR